MTKREKLEASGWKVTSVEDFLQLTPEESAMVEIRMVLSSMLQLVIIASHRRKNRP